MNERPKKSSVYSFRCRNLTRNKFPPDGYENKVIETVEDRNGRCKLFRNCHQARLYKVIKKTIL